MTVRAPIPFALAIALLAAQPAHAQTWIGGSGNDWSTAANWSGGVAPPSAPTTSVTFGSSASSFTPNVDTSWTINRLNLAGPGFSLGGAQVEFAGPGAAISVTQPGNTMSNPIVFLGALTVGTSVPFTLAGDLLGSGSLTKAGAGTLTLTGSTFNVDTTVDAPGTLRVGNGVSGPANLGNVVVNGTLVLDAPFIALNGPLSGDGAVVVEAGAIVNNFAAVPLSHRGPTTIHGRLNGAAFGASISNNAPLTIGPTGELYTWEGTVGSLSGSGLLSVQLGTFTAGGDDSSTTFTGTLQGPDHFRKAGAGTMTIATGNWTIGDVTVDAPGTLRLGDGTVGPGNIGNVTVNGTLVFHTPFIGVSGPISGGGSVLIEAGSTVNNFAAVPFSHRGSTTVNGRFNGASFGTSLSTGGRLTIGPAGQVYTWEGTVGSLAGSGLLSVQLGTFTAGGDNTSSTFTGTMQGPDHFRKTGSGTLTIATSNWSMGNLTVEAPGTLRLGDGIEGPGNLGGIIVDGTLSIATPFSSLSGPVTGGGSIVIEAGATLNNFSPLPLAHRGSTTINGRLNGAFVGASISNNGPLTIGPSGELHTWEGTVGSLSGSGLLSVQLGTFTVGGDNSSTTFTGTLQGPDHLRKAGAGTMTIATSNWSIGNVTVDAPGTLRMGNGTVGPPSVGGFVVNGQLAFATPAVSVVGPIGGAGSVTVEAGSVVSIQSPLALTHTGPTVVAGHLSSPAWPAIANDAPLTLTGTLTTSGGSVGSLSGNGSLLLGGATFAAGGDNTSSVFSGAMNGPGTFVKRGTGTLTLSGSAPSNVGHLHLAAGTLAVTGAVGTSSLTVASGATLAGTGAVNGPVAVDPGGAIAPGPGAALLATQSLSISGTLRLVVNGTTPGTQHGRLNVSGAVALNNATLVITGAHVPAAGQSFVLIANDGTDPIAGTFAALPQGATLTFNGAPLRISYTGGDGNDVVLSHATYTVTPSAGAHGAIAPATPQTVAHGATATFTVTPETGYAAMVAGTCGGTLVGTTYTTNAVTADCTVAASFTANNYTVTPSAGANGTISPDTPQLVAHGATVTFTVTPATGYAASVGGSCGGALAGTTYTTSPVTAACTVVATFTIADPARLGNLSTRMQVLTGNDVMIGGFVVGGAANKNVVVRARGPSLVPFGVANALANPRLGLVRSADGADVAFNDDWITNANVAAIVSSGFAPSNDLEAAMLVSLPPGAYTAVVSGVGDTTGVGIVEVFELDGPASPLVNLSTRGQVLAGENVMIGGFVIQGQGPQTVVVRARGPSLVPFGVPNALANPVLTLVRSSDQVELETNDNWLDSVNATQLGASGFAPSNSLESGIYITLQPGAYTAIVRGVGGTTGVAIVEVFAVN